VEQIIANYFVGAFTKMYNIKINSGLVEVGQEGV
jgi:hypothetical protein